MKSAKDPDPRTASLGVSSPRSRSRLGAGENAVDDVDYLGNSGRHCDRIGSEKPMA